MGVASQETVILFNYRGANDHLGKLVLISGRQDTGGLLRDGVRVLSSILNDALSNHGKNSLNIPKKAVIKLNGKANILIKHLLSCIREAIIRK